MRGLYIHIPFCQSKCHYCGFNSRAGKLSLVPEFITALEKQLHIILDKFKLNGCAVDTIYFGGGTPSILNSKDLLRIFSFINKNLDITKVKEISIEVNPETVNSEAVLTWKEFGFNRISLGAQYFEDEVLKFLGRRHTVKDNLAAFDLLRGHGFKNINIDLIYSIPCIQANDYALLEKVCDLKPEHISAYQFTIEENTYFAKCQDQGLITQLSEEDQAEIYYVCKDFLESNGYNHYEISNYCAESKECIHNTLYWDGSEYIGLGAGSHSYINGSRFAAVAEIEKYIDYAGAGKQILEFYERLNRKQQAQDAIIFGLRMLKGVDLKKIEAVYGTEFMDEVKLSIDNFLKEGYLNFEDNNLKLTRKGIIVYDEIAAQLLLKSRE